jgi:hypothetical protein
VSVCTLLGCRNDYADPANDWLNTCSWVMNTQKYFRLLHCSLLLMCSIAGASDQGPVIDQSLQIPALVPRGNYNYSGVIATLRPGTGQEFTPTLPGLDFVDVSLVGSAVGDTFQVAIHQGTITAPVLGLSEPTVSPGKFSNNQAHFIFSRRVPLVAGSVYVLEIIQGGSYSGWGVESPMSAVVNGQTIDMRYPGGGMIYNGAPLDSRDLLFREGIDLPYPVALSFVKSNNFISLRWPATAEGYKLEAISNLSSPSIWEIVTNTVTLDQGTFSVMMEANTSSRLFRLKYQRP